LPIFQDVFAATDGFVFQTDGERRLTEGLFPSVATAPQLQLGLGVEEQAGDPDGFIRQWDLEDTPYLLCLGRVDDGKGAALLAKFFVMYTARRPGPLKLVFAGPVVDRPIDHPDIVVTGPLSEELKWGALRKATALVSPSPFEAFSIVLMEAWTADVPVIVHGRCHATVEHVRRSGGGLPFAGYASFEVALDRLLAHPELRRAMASAGHRYVEDNFAWSRLIDRYTGWLQRLAG
jgi:glycosyltransferase involved in cell wall biosynthesis